MWTDWRGSRGPSRKGGHVRKGTESWVCSALREEGSGEALSSCSSVQKVATEKMEILFLQEVTSKRHGLIGTSFSWGVSI